MEQTDELKASLKREYSLCANAMAFYRRAIQGFEQKHGMTTQGFLKKFASGKLGDDADFFDWYAFANLLARARKTTSAIRSALQDP
jgi:hypothetical protein